MKPKNLLFITADQWRGECLSCLQHPVVRTPNLDALASDGVLFSQHFAQGTPCGPSRASIFTGMYLANHRSVVNGIPLDARYTTLALEMRKLGYEPALIGHTDITPDPRVHAPEDPMLKTYEGILPGFGQILTRHSEGRPEEWVQWLEEERGYRVPKNPHEIYEPISDSVGFDNPKSTLTPPIYLAKDSDTAFETEKALQFLRYNSKNPWCLHISYARPHPPYIAPHPYNHLYNPEDVPSFHRAPTIEKEARQHPYLAFLLEQQAKDLEKIRRYPSDALSMRQLRAVYYGLITEVDHQVGRILTYLKETAQYEETLIVFCSDHGEQLWDHWLLGKGPYFDECFRVPLIVRAPGKDMNSSRGRVVKYFSENIDIMPTILDLFEADIPLQCDGASLRILLLGKTPDTWRTEVHWEIDFRDVEKGLPEKELGISLDECCLIVIRDDNYKYVHFAALPPLFFDLKKDPYELCNLAENEEYKSLILKYAQMMLSWRMLYNERTLSGMVVSEKGIIKRHRS